MTTERKSLLTQGLEPLAEHSPRMRGLLQQLYALDDDLQDAHFLAKRDDEFGEDVVQKYKKFLAFRQIVIDELEKQKVPVPWQMRMHIDDLELTLRQREENKNGGQKGAKSTTAAKKSATTKAVGTSESKKKTKKSAATSAAPPSAAEVRVVSFVAPTLVALVGALLCACNNPRYDAPFPHIQFSFSPPPPLLRIVAPEPSASYESDSCEHLTAARMATAIHRRCWRKAALAARLVASRGWQQRSLHTVHSDPTAAMVADALTSSPQIGDLTNLGLFARKEDKCGRLIAHRVLVVGDGNFSFARAFLRSNADRIASNVVSVTATSLDTHDELLKMYPNSGEILDELKDGGVRVIHGVNATKLKEYPLLLTESDAGCDSADATAVDASSTAPLLFDRIVFNFPHFAEGGSKRNKIHLHRKLLRDFFQSAQDVLTRQGLIWVTLCAGQGGTALDTKQRAWGDTWQIVHCAADNGLIMHNIHLCPVEQLADLGYYSVGYKLAERGFWTPDSLTHVFCRENVGLRAQLPIEWSRGISFWIHEGYTEQKLEAILRECFPEPIRFSYSLTDQHVCPKTHRTSVTYTVKTSCDRTAFAKHRVNEWTLKAIQILKDSDFASSRAE